MKRILFFFLFILPFAGSYAQGLEVPVIDSVTVQTDLKVGIYWSYNNKAAVDGYRIKRRVYGVSGVIDGSFVNIVTINDPNKTFFIDTTTNYSLTDAQNRQEAYSIVAYTYNGTDYEYSNLSEEHKTIQLHKLTYDECENTNTLIWTNYFGWSDSISAYEVHYQTNEMSNSQFLTSVNASDTSFVHSGLTANLLYNYFIRAKHKNGVNSSTSNFQTIETKQPEPPSIMNADFSEVLNNSEVKLSFTMSLGSETSNFKLLRAENMSGIFDTLQAFQLTSSPYEYIDSIDVKRQYFYKTAALNDCEQIVKESNTTSNIPLSQKLDETEFGLVHLSWKSYKNYQTGLQYYRVMRKSGSALAQELGTTTDTVFSDEAGNLINNLISSGDFSGNICYYIEAVENTGNPTGTQGISKSNLSCIALEPKVVAPNAFNPQSYIEKNNRFLPYVSFAKSYKLQILSRWGNVVFETTDVNQAWNGRINGDYAREGTYIYVIKITAPNDEYHEFSGTITVFY